MRTAGAMKDPMLMFHGLLGSTSNLRRLALHPLLSKDRRVVVGDLRNHGASFHDQDASIEAMAHDVMNLGSTKFPGETPILLGHSLGGLVSMAAALRHPDVIKALVVVDIAPVNYNEGIGREQRAGHMKIIQAMMNVDFGLVQKEAGNKARNYVEELLKPEIPELGIRQFVMQNLFQDEQGTWKWRCNLQSLKENFLALGDFKNANVLHGSVYHGPTLFVAGEFSKYILPKHMEKIKQLFPNAELTTIANAGHWVHADNATEFAQHVGNFLSKLG
jgi:pimeloyl-ACP methyl ester carboxylesterase